MLSVSWKLEVRDWKQSVIVSLWENVFIQHLWLLKGLWSHPFHLPLQSHMKNKLSLILNCKKKLSWEKHKCEFLNMQCWQPAVLYSLYGRLVNCCFFAIIIINLMHVIKFHTVHTSVCHSLQNLSFMSASPIPFAHLISFSHFSLSSSSKFKFI